MNWTGWSCKCLKSKSKMAPRWAKRRLKAGARGAGLAACLWLAVPPATAETIVEAKFEGPTDRYGHGVLGDAIEYTELVIVTEDWAHRTQYRLRLPDDHVFEDLAPRLWDITGDGMPEVVVIETDMARGGSLAVYDQTGKIAETPHIGRTNRWLAPIGAADFDGDGRMEVAFVDRPHLAKLVRVFEWDGAALVLEAELQGFTNHRIGEDFITGGVRDCGAGPEMIVASADWSRLVAVRMGDGLESQDLAAFSQEAVRAALACAR